ncbi:hypothetical protein [Microbacterium sp. Se63.02b]|uniref:hypothetical protein n=1 Tax=Microbacterium sp. Se63.02b TaxID=2709304 RepID=UPI001FCE6D3A|nr:hypothetical protein [Microbacterium sp. Se63.02b]
MLPVVDERAQQFGRPLRVLPREGVDLGAAALEADLRGFRVGLRLGIRRRLEECERGRRRLIDRDGGRSGAEGGQRGGRSPKSWSNSDAAVALRRIRTRRAIAASSRGRAIAAAMISVFSRTAWRSAASASFAAWSAA